MFSEKGDQATKILDLINNLPGVAYVFESKKDGSFSVPYISDRIKDFIGIEPSSITEDSNALFDVVHPDDKERFSKNLKEIMDTENEPYVEELRFMNGEDVKWAIAKSTPQKQPDGSVLWTGYIDDITEKKEAELATKETRDYLQIVLNNLPLGVAIADPDGTIETCNPALAKMVKRTTEEIVGQDQGLLHTGKSGNEATPTFKQHRDSVGPNLDVLESVFTTSEGEEIIVEIKAGKIIVDGREKVLGIFADVTERKKMEEELKKSIDNYEKLFNSTFPLAVHEIIVGEDGEPCDYVFERVNPAFLEVLGLKSADDIVGKSVRTLIPDIEPELIERYGKVATTGESDHFTQYSTALDRWFDIIAFSPELGQFATIFTDITDQKRLQEQLLQSQKMEGIGRLAGGIAHDFNNILTAIQGNISLAQMEGYDSDHPLMEYINELSDATQRAAALTRQLLAFSRKQVLKVKHINLNELTEGLLKFLHRIIGEDINIQTDLLDGLGTVKVDPGQIEQVLTNLSVNAKDAMPNGGRIEINTQNVQLNTDQAKVYNVEPGVYVEITFKDNGQGMDSTTTQKIFEPFFTTKDVGKGTGLGLSTCIGIIKQHKGGIKVNSTPEKGTTFTIVLPCINADSVDLAKKEQAELIGGSETILFVEDDAMVRKITKTILEKLGYKVIVANNAEDAKNQFAQTSSENVHIDLLLTDVIMPGEKGTILAEKLKKQDPNLKVILASGYPEDNLGDNMILMKDDNFIGKPFTPQQIVKKLREVLDMKKVD